MNLLEPEYESISIYQSLRAISNGIINANLPRLNMCIYKILYLKSQSVYNSWSKKIISSDQW